MKNYLIATLLLILGFNFQASAQWRLGIQASPAITWMASNDLSIGSSGPGVAIKLGPVGEYYFQENYAILTGIAVVFNQGGTLTHTIGGNIWPNAAVESRTDGLDMIPNGSTLGYKFQMVEIPIGLKMRTNEIGYIRYYGETPFTIGIRTQARGSVNGGTLTTSKENITKDTNLLNFSWGIGGGLEYSFTQSTALVAGINYQGGILDLTKESGLLTDGTTLTAKVVMHQVNFKLAVMF